MMTLKLPKFDLFTHVEFLLYDEKGRVVDSIAPVLAVVEDRDELGLSAVVVGNGWHQYHVNIPSGYTYVLRPTNDPDDPCDCGWCG